MFIFGNFKCYFLTLHPKEHLCTKFHVKIFSRIGNNSESLKVLSLSSKVKVFFKIQYLCNGLELRHNILGGYYFHCKEHMV